MVEHKHPITPPLELVREWAQINGEKDLERFWMRLATQAARWGADQELEACVEWFVRDWTDIETADKLRAARRPKPPSLAEQALEEIQQMEGAMYSADLGCDFTATRAALERLQHLEQESNDN